ncbi:MAG TPA: CHAT domain-containing protein [Vicinamibacterales bacterium]
MRQAIDTSEEVLDDAAPATMREGFAINARATYEDLIRLLLDRGDSQEALVYAARARQIGQGRRNPHDVLPPLSRIPPSTSVVVMEVQPDGLALWLVAHDSIQTFRTRDRDIAARIAEVTRTLPSEKILQGLYELLVRSWINQIPTGDRLLISPPPALANVPFAALTDRYSRRSLVDDFAIEVIQDLSCVIDAPIKLEKTDRAVIVGDPAYHDLQRLPRTRVEAVAIAALYAHSKLLLEHDATRQHVLSALANAEIFHFGGHAIVNDLAPELSSLMLSAGDDSHDSRLYLHELTAHRMPLKLVVLSGCSTAARARNPRRPLSLARAFLQGGAGTVVGTLWPIPDDDASAFSTRFHESMSRGETAAEAVREAQLEMKARGDGDLSWAAFCLLRAAAVPRGGAGK